MVDMLQCHAKVLLWIDLMFTVCVAVFDSVVAAELVLEGSPANLRDHNWPKKGKSLSLAYSRPAVLIEESFF